MNEPTWYLVEIRDGASHWDDAFHRDAATVCAYNEVDAIKNVEKKPINESIEWSHAIVMDEQVGIAHLYRKENGIWEEIPVGSA